MTIAEALVKVNEYMVKNAQTVADQMKADGLVPQYRAKAHSAAAGRIIAWVLQNGVATDATNLTVLFHSLANHSAWRQKFEAKGIFPTSATERKSNAVSAEAKLAKLLGEFENQGGAQV